MAPSRQTGRQASALSSRPVRVQLEIIAGPGKGARQDIPEGATRLGRSSDSDFRVDNEAASRHHATIFRQSDAIVLRDAGSHNGTYVNEEEIREDTLLRAGDRLQIGDSVLCLIIDGVRERAPEPKKRAVDPLDDEDERGGLAFYVKRLVTFVLAIAFGLVLFIHVLPRLGVINTGSGTGDTPAPPTSSAAQPQPSQTGAPPSSPPSDSPAPTPQATTATPPAAASPIPSPVAPIAPASPQPAPKVVPPPPPPASAAATYRESSGRLSARKQEEESRRQVSRVNRARAERQARKLYMEGEVDQAIEVAEASGVAHLANQMREFRKSEGAARAAFSFKKGTEAIQHYEEAFALDEEICAADKSGRSSVPGRRVGQALSNLYLQAGEAFLKRDATRAETFLERSLDYDSNNARAREALKKLQAAE